MTNDDEYTSICVKNVSETFGYLLEAHCDPPSYESESRIITEVFYPVFSPAASVSGALFGDPTGGNPRYLFINHYSSKILTEQPEPITFQTRSNSDTDYDGFYESATVYVKTDEDQKYPPTLYVEEYYDLDDIRIGDIIAFVISLSGFDDEIVFEDGYNVLVAVRTYDSDVILENYIDPLLGNLFYAGIKCQKGYFSKKNIIGIYPIEIIDLPRTEGSIINVNITVSFMGITINRFFKISYGTIINKIDSVFSVHSVVKHETGKVTEAASFSKNFSIPFDIYYYNLYSTIVPISGIQSHIVNNMGYDGTFENGNNSSSSILNGSAFLNPYTKTAKLGKINLIFDGFVENPNIIKFNAEAIDSPNILKDTVYMTAGEEYPLFKLWIRFSDDVEPLGDNKYKFTKKFYVYISNLMVNLPIDPDDVLLAMGYLECNSTKVDIYFKPVDETNIINIYQCHTLPKKDFTKNSLLFSASYELLSQYSIDHDFYFVVSFAGTELRFRIPHPDDEIVVTSNNQITENLLYFDNKIWVPPEEPKKSLNNVVCSYNAYGNMKCEAYDIGVEAPNLEDPERTGKRGDGRMAELFYYTHPFYSGQFTGAASGIADRCSIQ